MPTLEEVQQQIKQLGSDVNTFGTKKEIRYLPDVLNDDESVLYLTAGVMEASTWLIVCTEQRVLLLDKGMLYGLKQKEISLKSISAVEQKTGMIFGEIAITVSSNRLKIESVAKHTVRPFVDVLNRARKALETSVVPSGSSQGEDMVSRLERLAGLKDRGMLTNQEFADQKSKILAMS